MVSGDRVNVNIILKGLYYTHYIYANPLSHACMNNILYKYLHASF